VFDVAGNKTTWTHSDTAVKIDLSPATIDLITSTTPNGWYMLGDTVNIQLQASEPVIIDSTILCSLSMITGSEACN
jgi:hypothetical protein